MWFLLISAYADGPETERVLKRGIAGHPVLDMRIGGGNTRSDHPTICLEGYPLSKLSVEACGTGQGVLHHDGSPDMAHFRGRFTAWDKQSPKGDFGLLVGAGVAEVQSTDDAAGFKFGAQQGEQIEAAGPEASVSMKGRFWTTKHSYVTADATVGGAWIAGAPAVLDQEKPTVPFASVTVGLGF